MSSARSGGASGFTSTQIVRRLPRMGRGCAQQAAPSFAPLVAVFCAYARHSHGVQLLSDGMGDARRASMSERLPAGLIGVNVSPKGAGLSLPKSAGTCLLAEFRANPCESRRS